MCRNEMIKFHQADDARSFYGRRHIKVMPINWIVGSYGVGGGVFCLFGCFVFISLVRSFVRWLVGELRLCKRCLNFSQHQNSKQTICETLINRIEYRTKEAQNSSVYWIMSQTKPCHTRSFCKQSPYKVVLICIFDLSCCASIENVCLWVCVCVCVCVCLHMG